MPSTRGKAAAAQQSKSNGSNVPMSAVAARKLAMNAAPSKPPEVSAAPLNEAPEASTSQVTLPINAHDDQSAQKISSDESSDSERDAAVPPKKRKRASRRDAAAKPERYWAPVAPEPEEPQITQQTLSGDSAPPSVPTTPKLAATKSRRERRHVIDQMCISAFSPDLDSNYFALQVRVDNVETPAKLFLLRPDDSLVIHGCFALQVLSGTIQLSSATLKPSAPKVDLNQSLSINDFQTCYAPSSHPLPVIRASPESVCSEAINLPNGKRAKTTDHAAAILVLERDFTSRGIENVMLAADVGVAAGLWPADRSGWRLVQEPLPSLVAERVVFSWDPLIARLTKDEPDDRLVVLVEGPKRSGKSTFARRLANSLLSRHERVAYLDTDLGQPEFAPSGFVSVSILEANTAVLGPPFCHPSSPYRMHFVGDISPANSPRRYIDAIEDLADAYRFAFEQEQVPLVINTHGWIKGLGRDLLTKIKGLLHPTCVVRIDSEGQEVVRPVEENVINVEPAPPTPLESKWTAADLRTLSIVSNAYAVLPPLGLANVWDFSTALVAKRPFALDWTDRTRLTSVHILGADIKYEHALYALNASLVAVVVQNERDVEIMQDSDSANVLLPYDPSLPAPSCRDTRALGLALVRSIDPANHTLHLLTSIDPQELSRQPVMLVKGSIELPIPLMLDHTASEDERERGVCGVDWTDVPYLTMKAGEQMGGRKRVRRNVMRRSQQQP